MAAGHGRAALTFACRGSGTVLAAQHCTVPLAVRELMRGPDGVADVALLNVSGGILGGDTLELEIEAGPGARVRLVTIGATRVYRAGAQRAAHSSLVLRVAPGASVEYLPDQTIPYAGARYEAVTHLHLASGSRVLLCDVLAPGRQQRGEMFAYDALSFTLRADRDGRPLVRERVVLEPRAERGPECRALFGRYTHLASLYAFGWPGAPQLSDALHHLLERSQVYGSASVAAEDVVLLRILGHSAHAVGDTLRQAASLCRDHALP